MLRKERRDSGQNDLFKSRLDQIVEMNHALAKLARKIDWGFSRADSGRSTPMFPAGRRG
jgi:IS5 family transposase